MQDPPDEVATKHAAKRISTPNEHEGHFLRRRLDAYKKVHDKELNDVVSHLEEIRETVNSLSTEPSYVTRAVPASPSSKPRNACYVSTKNRLQRTQSLPEVKSAEEMNRSFPMISAKNYKHGRASGYPVQSLNPVTSGGATMAHEPLRMIAERPSSPTVAASPMLPVHKKVERSKTAPITILQPLLKTTPEMMKKKILISNSPRQPLSHQKTPSPPRSDGADSESSLDSSAAGRGRPSTGFRRKVIPSSFDSQTNPNSWAESPAQNFKTPSSPSSVSAYCEPSSKAGGNRPEEMQEPARLARDVRSSNSNSTRVPHHETRFTDKHSPREIPRVNTVKKVDDHESSRSITTDLKQCRYLQFVKDRLEDNFI